MKIKSLVLIIMALCGAFVPCFATDDTPVVETRQSSASTYYIEVVSTINNATMSEQVVVDFGRVLPARIGVKDADLKRVGRAVAFNNSLDALNFLARRGWTLASTYTLNGRTSTITHFVMSITADEPIDVAKAIMSLEK